MPNLYPTRGILWHHHGRSSDSFFPHASAFPTQNHCSTASVAQCLHAPFRKYRSGTVEDSHPIPLHRISPAKLRIFLQSPRIFPKKMAMLYNMTDILLPWAKKMAIGR